MLDFERFVCALLGLLAVCVLAITAVFIVTAAQVHGLKDRVTQLEQRQ